MSLVYSLPLFCIVLGLVSSVVCSVLPGKWTRYLCFGLTGLVFAMSLAVLFAAVRAGENVLYPMGHYPHPWGNEIKIGVLEPLFSAVFALVLFLCVLGGRTQLKADVAPEKENLYYVMVCLIQTALLALVYTNDLFTGYVFVEISTIASCGILMIRQVGRTTLASVRYMIFSLIGSGLFLLGIVFLYNVTGHLLFPDLKRVISALWQAGQYRVAMIAAICLITVGLGIKSGLFPFHLWMPDTYGYATPSSAGILSGLVSKGYIFLLLKIIFDAFGTKVFYDSGVQHVLYWLGLAGMIAGSVAAMGEQDVGRMVAYSSAAQIGYIYMGMGISPTVGMVAAMFHILTHALTKPGLFLSVSQLARHTGGSRTLTALQGTARLDRAAGVAFLLGSLSMIGIPGTMGFLSKYLFARAAVRVTPLTLYTLVALAVSTILNTFYFTRALIRIYNRPLRPLAKDNAPKGSFCTAALGFGLINIALGIAAQPLVSLLEQGIGIF